MEGSAHSLRSLVALSRRSFVSPAHRAPRCSSVQLDSSLSSVEVTRQALVHTAQAAGLSPARVAKRIRQTAASLLTRPLGEALAEGRMLEQEGLLAALQLEDGPALASPRAADVVYGLCILGSSLRFGDEVELALQMVDLSRASPSEVTGMLWAMARANHRSPRFPELCQAAENLLERLSAKQKLSLLHSIARLHFSAEETPFVDAVASSPTLGGEVLSYEQLAVCAWSLAVLDRVNTPLCRACWEGLTRQHIPSVLSRPTRTLNQLHQVGQAVRLEGNYPVVDRAWESIAEENLRLAGGCWRTTLHRRPLREVVTQKEVAATLFSLGMRHTVEDLSSGFAIDVALPQVQLALEADGPTHYPRQLSSSAVLEPQICLGHTAFKHRQLRQMGWGVLSLNEWSWGEYSNVQERRSRLVALIEACLERL